jgi:hypothetical protein
MWIAYHLQRTRLERVAERKLRRRLLTEDGNVEITGRDSREPSAAVPARQKLGAEDSLLTDSARGCRWKICAGLYRRLPQCDERRGLGVRRPTCVTEVQVIRVGTICGRRQRKPRRGAPAAVGLAEFRYQAKETTAKDAFLTLAGAVC